MGKVNQDIKTRKPLQKCELEKKKNERRKKKGIRDKIMCSTA